MDWILVGGGIIFLALSQYLDLEANAVRPRALAVFLKTFGKFIEAFVVGAIVVMVFKYYKMS